MKTFLVLLPVLVLCLTSVPVDIGEFVEFDMYGLGPWGWKCPGTTEKFFEYVPYETSGPREEPVDYRTHYHYDYQVIDHVHYVTLNYLEGIGD